MQELTIDHHNFRGDEESGHDPVRTITELSGAYCLPRCLHVVANLGVADVLDETARTAGELAADVGANADALGRALRLLADHGVFSFDHNCFSHTPASLLLRSDHPQSLRAFVRMFGLPIYWDIQRELEHSILTGQPAISQVYPDGFWAYFSQHPEESKLFNDAMTAKAHGLITRVPASYDFSRFSTIADIGGGAGHLLQAILDEVPAAKGVLFDLPHVIGEAQHTASERLTLQAGDFFKDELPACDAYLLMEVLHNWNDEDSIAILSAVRRAALPNATVLIIDGIMHDQPGLSWPKMIDIHMLAFFAGKQRTEEEFEALISQSGFRLKRVIDTRSGFPIIEATVC